MNYVIRISNIAPLDDRTMMLEKHEGSRKPHKSRHKVSFNLTSLFIHLAPVVQRVDNAIQRISIGKTKYAIRWIVLSTL